MIMKKSNVLLGLLLLASVSLFSQTKTSQTKTSQIKTKKELTINSDLKVIKEQSKTSVMTQEKLPSDFPLYKNTGDKKADGQAFHDAKQKWIKDNPERFEKIKHLNLNVSIYNTKE
jgi:hypothetical protein